MYKVITVITLLMVCCYCANDNELLVEDARAKKKKNTVRLWAMILLFVFSKVAVFKVVSVMLFMAVFQKLFYFAGILLNYFMKQRAEKPAPSINPVYGPPSEYNTIGYSYGPPSPETESFPGQDYGLPSLTDIGGSFNNWLMSKNAK